MKEINKEKLIVNIFATLNFFIKNKIFKFKASNISLKIKLIKKYNHIIFANIFNNNVKKFIIKIIKRLYKRNQKTF